MTTVSLIVVGISGTSAMVQAAPPVTELDEGAFVRILGNPEDGTIKFQYGWLSRTPASDAAGYWVGVYDVTNSRYLWNMDTGSIETKDAMFKNSRPISELSNGDYKVVFFVRETYVQPVENIAEIELPFTVNNSMMGG